LRVGQRLAGRRHHAAAQFLDDGFPDFGVLGDVGEGEALERELGRTLGVVVAIGAVAVERRFRRGGLLLDTRLASGQGEREGGDGGGAGELHNPPNLMEKRS
jgi:hypothetical protein